MYTNITYLAQSYFHQDYQDEAGEPIEVVESFRDSEPADVVQALHTEIVALLASAATDEDLARIWLDDAGAYYDPEFDDITARQWLTDVAGALTGDVPPATEQANPGIPMKGSHRP